MHPVMVYEGEKLCMDEDTMNAVFKEEDLVPQECNFQCVNASRCQVSGRQKRQKHIHICNKPLFVGIESIGYINGF